MFRHRYCRFIVLSFLSCVSAAGAAHAETPEDLRREVEMLRAQLATYARQLQAVGERLQQLEAASRPLTVVPPAAATSVTPPVAGTASTPASTTSATGPTLSELATPRQPFALGQPGRVLLFDIGASGDFVADFTSATRERRRDGTFAGRENRLFPREVELGVFGRVDPYASAVVRISAGEEPAGVEPSSGELGVKLDEANVSLLTLPLGTTARFGLMRPRFGTLNTVHQDDLPQVDRPNVLSRFFGEEQLDTERGMEAFWVLPVATYHELSVGVFNGDNEVAFGRGSLRDPLVIGRWRTFFELEDQGGLQLDVSVASGSTTDHRRNTVMGLGAKYKWSAPGLGFPLVTVAGEALVGLRDVGGGGRSDRWGAYLYGQYDVDRRWAGGVRADWTEFPVARGREWALSPYVQFRPSEFLRFRLQYKHSEGTGDAERVAEEIFLQGTFILGAHPTERF